MTQYLLLIQRNTKTSPSAGEWDQFFTAAQQSGFFKGGSALGERWVVGDPESAERTDHIVGFMRFDSADKRALLDLLRKHPVVIHGGAVELCEMPKS